MAEGNKIFPDSLGVVGEFGFIKYITDPFGGSFNGLKLECYGGFKKEINEKNKKKAPIAKAPFLGKDNSYYFRSNHTSMTRLVKAKRSPILTVPSISLAGILFPSLFRMARNPAY